MSGLSRHAQLLLEDIECSSHLPFSSQRPHIFRVSPSRAFRNLPKLRGEMKPTIRLAGRPLAGLRNRAELDRERTTCRRLTPATQVRATRTLRVSPERRRGPAPLALNPCFKLEPTIRLERTTCRGLRPLLRFELGARFASRAPVAGDSAPLAPSPRSSWSRRSDSNGRPAHYENPTTVRKISDLGSRDGRMRQRAARGGE